MLFSDLSPPRKLSIDSTFLIRGNNMKEKPKYIDISNGKEPVEILLPLKDRIKLIKTFNYSTHYITNFKIESPLSFEDYELPPNNHCDCKGICSPATCNCILDHCQKYECNEGCPCGIDCFNRRAQNGIYRKLLVKYINKTKGFGLFANENINKGDFVCEYIGEIISKKNAEKKLYQNNRLHKPNYILQIKESYDNVNVNTYIDAEEYGNCARFINHSCSPNLDFDFIRIKYYIPEVIFIANKDIESGEELSFSYMGDKETGFSSKLCECKSKNCKKYIPN